MKVVMNLSGGLVGPQSAGLSPATPLHQELVLVMCGGDRRGGSH